MTMTGNPNDITISAVGINSSFGGIVDAAAAFRCGMSRGRELTDWPYFDEEYFHQHFIIGHPAAGLSEGFHGIGRYIKMAVFALNDMQQYLNMAVLDPDRLGISFVFPKNATDEIDLLNLEGKFGAFLNRWGQLCKVKTEVKIVRTYFEGKVGIISAIQDAFQLLKSGNVQYHLICSLDTLLDSRRLGRLIALGKVKTVDNPKGLAPGEGACFALLENINSSKDRGITPKVVLEPPTLILFQNDATKEQKLDDKGKTTDGEQMAEDKEMRRDAMPQTGEALSKVMIKVLGNAQGIGYEKGTIYCDLNGEDFLAADFGNALVRSHPRYFLRDWKLEIPALSFGDTGSAFGLLAVCLATQAFSRGYSVGDKALIVISTEEGNKGAVVLRRV